MAYQTNELSSLMILCCQILCQANNKFTFSCGTLSDSKIFGSFVYLLGDKNFFVSFCPFLTRAVTFHLSTFYMSTFSVVSKKYSNNSVFIVKYVFITDSRYERSRIRARYLVSSSTQSNEAIAWQKCIPGIVSPSDNLVPENIDQSLCRVTFPPSEVHTKQI